jgi:tetratricopeptide (TPR) repeat protein
MTSRQETQQLAIAHYRAAGALFDTDRPGAFRRLQQALELFDQTGDTVGSAAALSGMAEVLFLDGEYERALASWEHALRLDLTRDIRALSVTLDKMACSCANLSRWPRALELWRQALDIDRKVGNIRNQAITLLQIGKACATLGDHAGALAVWNEALPLAETSDAALDVQLELLRGIAQAHMEQNDARQALRHWQRAYFLTDSRGEQLGSATLRANAATCLDELGELSSAVALHLEALATFEGLNDEPTRMAMLRVAARALARNGEAERACAMWKELLEHEQRLGDKASAAATLRLLAQSPKSHRTMFASQRSAGSTGPLLSGEPSFSLSEYTLAPASAPLFRLGELLAALHAGGICCGQLVPGQLELMADGTAAVAHARGFEPNQSLDPKRMAADFRAPFATYPWEDFRAILAGYVRTSYERLDHLQAGYTDSLLDVLGVPEPRPRPRPHALDVPRLLADLGLELVVTGPAPLWPALIWLGEPPPRRAPLGSPTDACLLLLCCLLLEVQCTPTIDDVGEPFGPEQGPAVVHYFAVIRGREAPVAPLLAKLPPGLELAVHFALQVRGIFAVGDASFMGTRAALHEALHSPTLDQAGKLGDALIDVALYCARLLEQQSATFIQSISYAQKAVMLLQSQATGLAQDDARLAALTRSLCGRSWYPAQYSKAAWPAKPVEVGLSNSLLLTYRAIVVSALSLPEDQTQGVLWSAAFRGIDLARSTVRQVHALLGEFSPKDAATSLALLPVIVRCYAFLLDGLLLAATREQARAGRSGWLELFLERDGMPSYLEQERRWIRDFLSLAEAGEFSLAAVNEHVRRGAPFISRRGPETALN